MWIWRKWKWRWRWAKRFKITCWKKNKTENNENSNGFNQQNFESRKRKKISVIKRIQNLKCIDHTRGENLNLMIMSNTKILGKIGYMGR